MMRNVYIGLVVLVTAAVLLFKVQNLQSVTVSFLTMSLTMPVSVAIVVVYFLGMVSGGALIAAMRSLVQKARAP
ncbi:MAG: LapA family protein [Deltaproteobacteria bacterium]